MIKAIIFDFFGVICLDLYWTWLKIHVPDLDSKKQSFQALSNQLDLGAITREQFAKTLSEKTGVNEAEVLAQMNEEILIDKEIVEFIKILKKNYKIGLLSNSNSHWLHEILKSNNLETLFNSLVISQEVGFIKPKPEIFEVALKRLEVTGQEAVFIDDRESNVVAAKKLGIKGIVYTDLEKLKKDISLVTG